MLRRIWACRPVWALVLEARQPLVVRLVPGWGGALAAASVVRLVAPSVVVPGLASVVRLVP
ncbi:hypothetical protein MGAST_07335 [Mycobacterium gastri 'Wayne']|nr:hypothetical protein MGAST_07335 [Mycobacterium gastri 'Wayne']